MALRESARLRADDVTSNGRFPSTTVPRTLLDLATRYDQRALLRVFAEAEFQHDLRPDDIVRTLRRGHPGSANLRAALSVDPRSTSLTSSKRPSSPSLHLRSAMSGLLR